MGQVVRSWEGVAVVDEAAEDMTAVDVNSTVAVVAVSLLLGEMEPDVRLKMTLPACRGNGAILPRVAELHVLVLDELSGPQQNDTASAAVNIDTPHVRSTRDTSVSIGHC